MANSTTPFKSGGQLSARSQFIWRTVQTAVWLVGATIFTCLIFFPELGVILFWNILIPIAPALIVVTVGIWRNVCPLATTVLLPRNLDLSRRKIMSVPLQGKLGLIAVIALYAIVPLRHAVFNASGHATAILLFSATVVGISMGFIYEWKSGWCSSLCPVNPVERMYGGNILFSLPNAHCNECMSCVIPCPDTTPNITPNASQKTVYHRLSGFLIIGGLPGFIWGWFHDPDNYGVLNSSAILESYKMPLIGFGVTLALYWALTRLVPEQNERNITDIFAASAVSCYYWYRIPSLLGFGLYQDDGLLVDLSDFIPSWTITATILATTLFFFYWIVVRKPNQSSWVVRPEYAKKAA